MSFNNEVRNSAGVIGYRCYECQKVKPAMWGEICNECREKERRHQETLNAQKAVSPIPHSVSDERLAQLIEYVDWTARTDKAVDEVQSALRELQQRRKP